MIDIEKIVKNYKTPLYVFDSGELKDRINYLKSKLTNCNIVYAVKANTFIIKEADEMVNRFEICSPGEARIANNLNINPNKMVISGVYKDLESISNLVKDYDVLKYTIESINQFKLLERLSKEYNKKLHILIRLTSGNQFGVNEDEFKEIIKNNTELIIDGIEYFSGTQKTSIKKINKEVDYLNEFINEIEEELNFKINEIEYGPGLPIHYFKDEEFDEDGFLSEVNEALDRLKHKELSLEIGRSIAATCGYYFTKVVDMKTNKNGNYVIVDGGINHLVYYGQTMAMRIPNFEIYPKRTGEEKNYNIYGSLCTINDIIVKNINAPELSLEDVFVFKKTGAYCVTEGISLFLSRDLPYVGIYKDDNLKIVRNNVKTSEINYPNY